MKIRPKKWIEVGYLDHSRIKDENDIINQCCQLMDDACTCEIVGPGILFEGEDGKYYTVVVEASIQEASPEFVKDSLAEKAEENAD